MSRKAVGQTKRQRYRQQIALFMEQELPSRTQQRAKPYRPTVGQAYYYFRLLNHLVFDDQLSQPKIFIRRLHKVWGYCRGQRDFTCHIHLTDRYYCRQWFLTVLAHEMCHQYQWQVLGQQRIVEGREPVMSHGPNFFLFKERLRRYSIPLKTSMGVEQWFRYQDLFRA